MIVSRTPFRVSLIGGGSDLAAHYRRRPGAVITMAMSRYMHVAVNRRFDDSIRVSYTRTEIVEDVDELQHDLIREAMKLTGVMRGVEIVTIADVPAGIGLASSSSLAVGVLNALYAFRGQVVSARRLAEEACEIEIERLQRPIGKQDQYIAAFGGLQHLTFRSDDSVGIDPVICPPGRQQRLAERLMLFYTGLQRDAGHVLADARHGMTARAGTRAAMDALVALVDEFSESLAREDFETLGRLLSESWRLKKQTSDRVSNTCIDGYYQAALDAGAEGGKISGAGGGGCLLLIVLPSARQRVRSVLTAHGLKEIDLGYEPQGSRLVLIGD